MNQQVAGSIKKFIIYSYVLFWCLFLITGAIIYFKTPKYVQIIFSYVCAWTSTFVFILLFKKIYPENSLLEYIKKQFSDVNILDFAIPMIIQILIIIISIIAVLFINKESVKNIKFISISKILPLFISNIIYGPMGEELGWRCYALNELQKKHCPFIASLIIGVLWGLWHFPLWFISGYSGYALATYILFFMLGIISLSVFLTYFYNKSKSVLVAIWIHFLFNYLLQISLINTYKLIIFNSIFYFIVIIVLVSFNKEKMLKFKISQT
jgi:hypothetical protein